MKENTRKRKILEDVYKRQDKSGPKKVIETIEHARHVLQNGTSLVVDVYKRQCVLYPE